MEYKIGTVLFHTHLGLVTFTLEAAVLQQQNTDPDSIFVEHLGDLKEVSKHLLRGPHEL